MARALKASGHRLPADLARDIEQLYEGLSKEISHLEATCLGRGDCCDFDRRDHRLYASSLEIAYVREAHPEPLERRGSLCPFWRDRRCTERDRRPLGCRTYFCDRRARDSLQALYEEYHGRLREISCRYGYAWSYEPFVEGLLRSTETIRAERPEQAGASSDRKG